MPAPKIRAGILPLSISRRERGAAIRSVLAFDQQVAALAVPLDMEMRSTEARCSMSRAEMMSFPRSVHPGLFLNEVNSAGALIGMPPVSAGLSISDAAKQFMLQLQNQLPTKFQNIYGLTLPAQNQDSGYLAPIEGLHPGDAPQCIVDQVKMDFSNWNLPTTTDIATRIASTLTMDLSIHDGAAGFAQGTLEVTANENIIWMVGYGAFTTAQNQLGAVYVFGATLQF
jgi:hypothetical protein